MQAMCDLSDGQLVGWATAVVSCDGSSVVIEYFNTSGASLGTTVPGGWGICRPTFASNVVYSIVEMTQAAYDDLVSKDPNTLYLIIG